MKNQIFFLFLIIINMRVIVVNKSGVHFHTGILKEEPVEHYCSCSGKSKSVRDLVMKDDDNVYITIPNNEYVALILRKQGTDEKPLHQRNPNGVSIFTTDEYMVMARFANSYTSALQYLQQTKSLPSDEDKYIVSVKKIEKLNATTSTNQDTPNQIFVYESSFGDVFSRENYTGEQTGSVQQMYTSLKRSSYTTLDDSYLTCWL